MARRRVSRKSRGLSGTSKQHSADADESVRTAIRKYDAAYSKAQVGECREAFVEYSDGAEAEGAADAHERYSRARIPDALAAQLDDSAHAVKKALVRNCFVKSKK